MPKISDSGRVILDQAAKETLNRMLSELKQEEAYIKISPSSLASMIIARYAEAGYMRDKEMIVQRHFNSKEYLKKAISSGGSDADLAKALESVLHKIRSEGDEAPRRKRKRSISLSDPQSILND